MVTAWCMKCKKKVEMTNPEKVEIKAKGGKGTRPALTDKCPTCGTKLFRIVSSGERHGET